MKTLGAVLSILGGILGLLAAIFTLFAGGVVASLDSSETQTMALGFGGLLLCGLVFMFAIVSFVRPSGAGKLVLILSVAALVYGGTFVAIAMLFSISGAIVSMIVGKSMLEKGIYPASNTGLNVLAISSSAITLLFVIMVNSTQDRGSDIKITEAVADLSIRPDGEVAEIFSFGSNHTDLQRDQMLKNLTGKVVLWSLPVYDVEESNGGYRVQTKSNVGFMFGAGLVSAFVHINEHSPQDREFLSALKEGDVITFKGVIAGLSMRHLVIRPAMLVNSNEADSDRESRTQEIEQANPQVDRPVPSTPAPASSDELFKARALAYLQAIQDKDREAAVRFARGDYIKTRCEISQGAEPEYRRQRLIDSCIAGGLGSGNEEIDFHINNALLPASGRFEIIESKGSENWATYFVKITYSSWDEAFYAEQDPRTPPDRARCKECVFALTVEPMYEQGGMIVSVDTSWPKVDVLSSFSPPDEALAVVDQANVAHAPESEPADAAISSTVIDDLPAYALESAVQMSIPEITSPSFDCAKAGNGSEQAICNDQRLAQLDRELASAYACQRTRAADQAARDGAKRGQLVWMRDRNRCGSDANCIAQSYEARLGELQAFRSSVCN